MKEESVKKNIYNRLLIISTIIVLKILLMGLFSSDYQNIMFIPFVNIFLDGHNPYDYYYENQLLP